MPIVVNDQPSKRIAYGLHTTFVLIYLLLFMRTSISLYEGPIDIAHLPRNSVPMVFFKRICGTLLAPFWSVGFPFPWDYRDLLTPALVIALLTYGLIHYGMFMSVSVEGGASLASKILNFCRAMFFLAGTLLVLLIVIRMGVLLYQDLVYGPPQVTIRAPERK